MSQRVTGLRAVDQNGITADEQTVDRAADRRVGTEDHEGLASVVRVRSADDDVIEPVAVKVADKIHGFAEAGKGLLSFDHDGIAGSHQIADVVDCRNTARAAEHDIDFPGGIGLSVGTGRRTDDQVVKAVAVEIALTGNRIAERIDIVIIGTDDEAVRPVKGTDIDVGSQTGGCSEDNGYFAGSVVVADIFVAGGDREVAETVPVQVADTGDVVAEDGE